nr:smoothelin-like protein 1 [Labrus bergylta]
MKSEYFSPLLILNRQVHFLNSFVFFLLFILEPEKNLGMGEEASTVPLTDQSSPTLANSSPPKTERGPDEDLKDPAGGQKNGSDSEKVNEDTQDESDSQTDPSEPVGDPEQPEGNLKEKEDNIEKDKEPQQPQNITEPEKNLGGGEETLPEYLAQDNNEILNVSSSDDRGDKDPEEDQTSPTLANSSPPKTERGPDEDPAEGQKNGSDSEEVNEDTQDESVSHTDSSGTQQNRN